ncbi:UBP-type zinc finger domain-containing protein [Streptacidiphilus neutrinimicus]|uniref:UBP-type zinc finger domain-containing protein n=1 Tax=Streptacidiphilus neutrinimicus TaxID=105420 RepID=UPI0005A92E88|nr:UBP-type zinc finger domain-containing protein [Streptacidiphilus neutrinimicus]
MSPSRPCAHLAELPDPEPAAATDGCPHCAELGQRSVALRRCAHCGHVGCCDSTPGRRAAEHHKRTGHGVMRGHEPGESGRWCYEDRRLV